MLLVRVAIAAVLMKHRFQQLQTRASKEIKQNGNRIKEIIERTYSISSARFEETNKKLSKQILKLKTKEEAICDFMDKYKFDVCYCGIIYVSLKVSETAG